MKEFIYILLEQFVFRKGVFRHISGFKVKIPIRYFKYFESDYELNNINFINNYVNKGDTVIDVGGHIGLLSIILAQKVGDAGKVYTFEPTVSTFKILKKSIAFNKSSHIINPINAAVSDSLGKATFYVTDVQADNANSLANNHREQSVRKTNEIAVEVDLTPIDELKKNEKLKKIDFIKIDAEGAELSVLKGASSTILQDKPKIILALHPNAIINFGDSLTAIWDYVQGLNYRMYYMDEEISKESFISQTDLFDVFMIPRMN